MKGKMIKIVLLGLSVTIQTFAHFCSQDFKQLATQAEKMAQCSFESDAVMTALDERFALVHKICMQADAVLGRNYLSIKNLYELEKKYKQELTKIHKTVKKNRSKETFATLTGPRGVVVESLNKAAQAAHEAAKWLEKAQSRLMS